MMRLRFASVWEPATVAKSTSADRLPTNPLLYLLMNTIVATVRSDTTDLSARQLAVFLKTYLEPATEHTVRGLAAALNVSKPANTRALAGSAYLRTLNGYVNDADKLAAKQTTQTA